MEERDTIPTLPQSVLLLAPAPERTVFLDGENRSVDDALGVNVLGSV